MTDSQAELNSGDDTFGLGHNQQGTCTVIISRSHGTTNPKCMKRQNKMNKCFEKDFGSHTQALLCLTNTAFRRLVLAPSRSNSRDIFCSMPKTYSMKGSVSNRVLHYIRGIDNLKRQRWTHLDIVVQRQNTKTIYNQI